MSSFFGIASRMKLIFRWSLMRNAQKENLAEHSGDVAMIVHALALIGNKRLSKNYRAEKLAVVGLYHDISEIVTGDLPTPVKYANNEIQTEYKKLEFYANERIIKTLPQDLQKEYRPILEALDLTEEEKKLLKGADKMAAYIKCIQEENMGNVEFTDAKNMTKKSLDELNLPEITIFLETFLEGYSKTLDELFEKEAGQ